MRRLLLACMAALFVLAVAGTASAVGPQNEFATGSAKTEVSVFASDEHASFSVHNVDGTSCEAFGKIVYKSEVFFTIPLEFEARLTRLVIFDFGTQANAFFAGPITRVKHGLGHQVGDYVSFVTSDSGLGGGMGDTFVQTGLSTSDPGCVPPTLPGVPIDQGNIVIETTGPLP